MTKNVTKNNKNVDQMYIFVIICQTVEMKMKKNKKKNNVKLGFYFLNRYGKVKNH